MSLYDGNQLSELLAASKEFGLEALVECYHREEVESLNWKEISILGVNNRNLSTFEVDLHRGVELLKMAPENVVTISESGIHQSKDLEFLRKNGTDAALIGEYFMRKADPGKALKEMIRNSDKIRTESVS